MLALWRKWIPNHHAPNKRYRSCQRDDTYTRRSDYHPTGLPVPHQMPCESGIEVWTCWRRYMRDEGQTAHNIYRFLDPCFLLLRQSTVVRSFISVLFGEGKEKRVWGDSASVTPPDVAVVSLGMHRMHATLAAMHLRVYGAIDACYRRGWYHIVKRDIS